MLNECGIGLYSRRRTFWTTQPLACGTFDSCGDSCGFAGLELATENDAPIDDPNTQPRFIRNDNFVRGLALNILLTDGRKPETDCGYSPLGRGGHWSDSFRDDGFTSGTLLRSLPAAGAIRDLVNLARVYAQADLDKLVDPYGVASEVSVVSTYGGGNKVNLSIQIIGIAGATTRIGVIGSRLKNSWAWGI